MSSSRENLKPQIALNRKIDAPSAVFGSVSYSALSELDIPELSMNIY